MEYNKVKIYIKDKGYLDAGVDFPLSFNFGVSDIRDISSRQANSSKTITIPGSITNNLLFGQLYNVRVIDQSDSVSFDLNKKYECSVIVNESEILRGFFQLVKVIKLKSSNNFSDDSNLQYECIFFDNTANFFNTIEQKYLTDLSGYTPSWTLSVTNITNSFEYTYLNSYKYITTQINKDGWDTDTYLIEWLHPAIYAHYYTTNIFGEAGYSFDSTFLTGSVFTKLLHPFTNSTPQKSEEYLKTNIFFVGLNSDYSIDNSYLQMIDQNLNFDNENSPFYDGDSVYDVASYKYTANITEKLTFHFNINAKIRYYPNSYIETSTSTVGSNVNIPCHIIVYKDGILDKQSIFTFGQTPSNSSFASNTDVFFRGGIDITTNVQSGSEYTFKMYIIPVPQQYILTSGNATIPLCQLTLYSGINGCSCWSERYSNYQVGDTIDLKSYFQKNIKQKDYLSGLFKLFNLYVEEDKLKDKTFKIKTRDDYYNTNTYHNWSGKIDRNKEVKLQFIPEVINKKVILKNKESNDDKSKIYKENFAKSYGSKEIIFNSEWLNGEQNIENFFESTPIVNQNGRYVSVIDKIDSPSSSSMKILYDGGKINASGHTNWIWIDYYSTSGVYFHGQYPYYCQATHIDNPSLPNLDLNFGKCDAYFFDSLYYTDNNLFNKYFYNTYMQMANEKMLTAYFTLDESDISNLSLSDKIVVDNVIYIINSIKDYNPLLKNSNCLVELLTWNNIYSTPLNKTAISQEITPWQGGITSTQRLVDWEGKNNDANESFGYNNTFEQYSNSNFVVGNNNTFYPGTSDNVLVNSSNNILVNPYSTNNTLINCNNIVVGYDYEITSATTTSGYTNIPSGCTFVGLSNYTAITNNQTVLGGSQIVITSPIVFSGGSLSGAAAGNNTEVQYNNNGSFGASSALTFSNEILSLKKLRLYDSSLISYSDIAIDASQNYYMSDDLNLLPVGSQSNFIFGNQTTVGINNSINYNTIIGTSSAVNFSGDSCSIVGYNAGRNLSGGSNSCYGMYSGNFNLGNFNTFLGSSAGYANTNNWGNYNTNVGYSSYVFSVSAETYANCNTTLGAFAGSWLAGSNNICIGYNAGGGLAGPNFSSNNICIGDNSSLGNSIYTIYYNTIIGEETINQRGSYNTLIGYKNGGASIVGYNAMLGNNCVSTGERNVIVGSFAASASCTSGNVIIGFGAGCGSAVGSDKLIISNSGTVNPLISGDFSQSSVTINGGINITSGITICNSNVTEEFVWRKKTVNYTDIATATTNYVLVVETMEPKEYLMAESFMHVVKNFTGGSISAIVASSYNDTTIMSSTLSIFAAGSNTTVRRLAFATNNGQTNIVSNWSFNLLFTSTGGNLNTLTAGQVDFYYKVGKITI